MAQTISRSMEVYHFEIDGVRDWETTFDDEEMIQVMEHLAEAEPMETTLLLRKSTLDAVDYFQIPHDSVIEKAMDLANIEGFGRVKARAKNSVTF